MVVESVTLVVLADGTCEPHIGTNWSDGVQAGYIRSRTIGPASKIWGNHGYTEAMLNPSLTLADVMPTKKMTIMQRDVASVQGDKVGRYW